MEFRRLRRQSTPGQLMSQAVSRRTMLRRSAIALGIAGASTIARGASAQEQLKETDKIKQSDAKYQNHPNGQQRCEICLQFTPPSRCKIVQGPIVPQGW